MFRSSKIVNCSNTFVTHEEDVYSADIVSLRSLLRTSIPWTGFIYIREYGIKRRFVRYFPPLLTYPFPLPIPFSPRFPRIIRPPNFCLPDRSSRLSSHGTTANDFSSLDPLIQRSSLPSCEPRSTDDRDPENFRHVFAQGSFSIRDFGFGFRGKGAR